MGRHGRSQIHHGLEIRPSSFARNRPVIALSPIGSPEEEAALLGMGFFDVIFKPINYVRLLSRIERTIRFFYHEQIPHA